MALPLRLVDVTGTTLTRGESILTWMRRRKRKERSKWPPGGDGQLNKFLFP